MLLPSSRGLSFNDDAETIAEQLVYPFVSPKRRTNRKNMASELKTGGVLLARVEMLQSKKRGRKAKRLSDSTTSILGEWRRKGGWEGIKRPIKSATLKMTK